MIPRQALLMAGRFYASQCNQDKLTDDDLIALAVEAMGLGSVRSFDPKMKILEERMHQFNL